MVPPEFGFRETLNLDLQHGRTAGIDLAVAQLHDDAGRLGLAEQVVDGALDRQLGAARHFTSARGRYARVQTGVFRFHVGEDQCQRVFVILQRFSGLTD